MRVVVSMRLELHCTPPSGRASLSHLLTLCHRGNKVDVMKFIPSAPALCLHFILSVSLQKYCIKQITVPSLCVSLNQRGANGRPGSVCVGPSAPSSSDPSPLPFHAKDTAKATAIVIKLFILSQDCVVIYTVNTENTL